MAYSVTWEPPGGVWLRLYGEVTAPEFIKAVSEVHSHHDYDGLRYVIDDLSDLADFDVDLSTVLEVLAASIGAGMVNPNRKIYVVSEHQKIVDYLKMVAHDYGNALPIALYSTLEQARSAIEADAGHQRLFKR